MPPRLNAVFRCHMSQCMTHVSVRFAHATCLNAVFSMSHVSVRFAHVTCLNECRHVRLRARCLRTCLSGKSPSPSSVVMQRPGIDLLLCVTVSLRFAMSVRFCDVTCFTCHMSQCGLRCHESYMSHASMRFMMLHVLVRFAMSHVS